MFPSCLNRTVNRTIFLIYFVNCSNCFSFLFYKYVDHFFFDEVNAYIFGFLKNKQTELHKSHGTGLFDKFTRKKNLQQNNSLNFNIAKRKCIKRNEHVRTAYTCRERDKCAKLDVFVLDQSSAAAGLQLVLFYN